MLQGHTSDVKDLGWSPNDDLLATCSEPYVSKAKDVCKAVAGAVKGSASAKLKVMYQAFGPQFGASAVFCREGGCCAGKPALCEDRKSKFVRHTIGIINTFDLAVCA